MLLENHKVVNFKYFSLKLRQLDPVPKNTICSLNVDGFLNIKITVQSYL